MVVKRHTDSKMKRLHSRGLFAGALEMMILGALRHGPTHGYAMARAIEEMSGGILVIEEGSLYPALKRLLKNGAVKAAWDVSTSKRRVRVYKITSDGIRQVDSEFQAFEAMVEGIVRVMKGQ